MKNEKVKAAQRTTARVNEICRRVRGEDLLGTRTCNGLDVFTNPWEMSATINASIKALQEAEKLLSAALPAWPSNSDYDDY